MADEFSITPSTHPDPAARDARLRRLGLLGGLVTVTLSLVASIIGYATLPARLRIHWTLMDGPYYGPEFAPTVVVVALFPLAIASIGVGAYWIGTRVHHADEFAGARPYYILGILGMLVTILLTQLVIFIANL